jgi:hypothetical protein
MTEIQINRTIAKNEISKQVDKGQQLLNSVKSPKTETEIQERHKRQIDWSRNTEHLLRRFFEDESLAIEYAGIGESLERQIAWLETLVTRIDDFTQSRRTPYGGSR